MKCPDSEALSAYADGECSPFELAALSEHLPACSSCSLKLKSVRAGKAALAGLSVPTMPEDLARSLGRMHVPSPRRAVPVWALAAAAVVLALVSGVHHHNLRRAASSEAAVEIPAGLLSAAHQDYALTMPFAPAAEEAELALPQLAGDLEGGDVY